MVAGCRVAVDDFSALLDGHADDQRRVHAQLFAVLLRASMRACLGQPFRSLGVDDVLELGEAKVEDVTVEEGERASAWFWVEAATRRSVASDERKAATSSAPMSPGWRLPMRIGYQGPR